jgi:hypothetical protein
MPRHAPWVARGLRWLVTLREGENVIRWMES